MIKQALLAFRQSQLYSKYM